MPRLLRHPAALAALALMSVPLVCQALDSAPGPAGSGNALTLRLSPLESYPQAKSAKPAEEYREEDLWGRIRSGYAIPDTDNPLVARHVSWYSTRPDYVARASVRASRYLYHVVTELEKRGMPTELALLPIIESAFNPQANSTASAVGMWQFMSGTGRDFDLKQNMFKDDRRGVLASTDAALTYLQQLYDMFGDWQLALAAYNWGQGNVAKAIKKNQALGKPTDFDSLAEHMPAETRNYVPKLQAVKNIIGNPAQYGVSLPIIENQPYFTAIDKTSDIDLAIAAKLAELSVDEFKALNPQFNRPVITGGEQTKILLPQANADKFRQNLAQWGRNLSTWTTHKITGAKETLASLASKFHTTPEVIRQANNIPARSYPKAGSTILVPRTSAAVGDIAEHVVDNAVMALGSERDPKRAIKLAKGSPAAAKGKVKAAIAAPRATTAMVRGGAAKAGGKATVAESRNKNAKKQAG